MKYILSKLYTIAAEKLKKAISGELDIEDPDKVEAEELITKNVVKDEN